MDELAPPLDSPATVLFPQFESKLYGMVATEVEGLSDPQIDWMSERWGWSKWNIRRQVSHIANVVPGWLLTRWGERLFPTGLSELGTLAEYPPRSPSVAWWLDETAHWDLPFILSKVGQGMRLAQYVLDRETVESARRLEIPRPDTPPHWRRFVIAHPSGVRWDDSNPQLSYVTLEATFRHLYFETTTHLYNIQRLKRAQGLVPRAEIPYVGYWALPDWDRSEP